MKTLKREADRIAETIAIRASLDAQQHRNEQVRRILSQRKEEGTPPLPLFEAADMAANLGYRQGSDTYYRAVSRLSRTPQTIVRMDLKAHEDAQRQQAEEDEASELLAAFDAIPDLDAITLLSDHSEDE